MCAEGKSGSFGLLISIDAEGFLDPTLKSITVIDVVAASPAATAGILSKDRITQIEGRLVEGAKANELKPYLSKNVGEFVHLRLRRPNGEEYSVTMSAAPK